MNADGSVIELCGCHLNADGTVRLYCKACAPRSPQEVAADICRQVSITCNIACSDARIGADGRWEVQTAPNLWQSYQTLMDAARKN